jgi:hypothetical protein
LLITTLALLTLPGASHAFSRCVTTAAQLRTAFTDAATTTDLITTIKIAANTYASTTGFVLELDPADHGTRTVLISGGWSSPSCSTRLSGAAAETVLVGSPAYRTLVVETDPFAQVNSIFISGLSLNNPGYSGSLPGACLASSIYSGHDLTLERLRIEQCVATANVRAMYISSTGSVYARNIVVKNNALDPVVDLNASGGGSILVTQLSLVRNADQSGVFLSSNGAGSQIILSNSIVWSSNSSVGENDFNAQYGSGGGIGFNRVHYNVLEGATSYNIAPSNGDPGFLSQNDLHLRGDSILVDSGVANPSGGSGTTDADDKPRVQGVAVDVGAYERNPDVIFNYGFD